MEFEVKVFWKSPKLYEWRIRAEHEDRVLAKGRTDSCATALEAGAEEAKRCSWPLERKK
jgi:hypothetical protein